MKYIGSRGLCVFSRPFTGGAKPRLLHAEELPVIDVIDVIKQRDGVDYINPALLRGGQTRTKLDPGLKDLVDSVL